MNLKKKLKHSLKNIDWLYYFCLYVVYKKRVYKVNKMTIEDKKIYLNNYYKYVFSRDIDWANPLTFTEKIQYFKLFNQQNELYAKLTDKYEVRNWIKDKIGEEYLIPLIGVYDSFEEIDYDSLPNQFVIKCNHDSGSVTVVKDKNRKQWNKLKYKYTYHLKTDFSKFTLESHYSLIKPRIIIEELIEVDGSLPPDYKFLCFDSSLYFCWVDSNREVNHMRNTYDMNWEKVNWVLGNYEKNTEINKPKNFENMKQIAVKLCEGFSSVRVDLYDVNGKIYFGEMTFSSQSGFGHCDYEVDKMLGDLWKMKEYKQ